MSQEITDASTFQVGPDTVVTLSYAAYDEDGERVHEGEQRLEFVFGYGQLLPPLENALNGLRPTQSRTVTLSPEQAFGRRDVTRIVEVERGEFPDEVSPGDHFEAETAEGGVVVLKVLDVDAERVVVDMNHPLAEQKVRFELRVDAVRPASEAEIEAATSRLEQTGAPLELIPPERLLRGPTQRYEATGHEPDPAAEPSKTGRLA
jgi:FKBP-type peptidyl-prolyl cis-trans isomerase SlyD